MTSGDEIPYTPVAPMKSGTHLSSAVPAFLVLKICLLTADHAPSAPTNNPTS
jgi:hypothetical protein